MKLVISDPNTGKAYNLELDEKREKSVVGLELGKVMDAAQIGLPGYKIQITGGSDKDGFPMRGDVFGRVRPKVMLGGPPGFRPQERGLRRRKRIRGNVVTSEIVQVNAKVVGVGKKPIEALFGQVQEGGEVGETLEEKKEKSEKKKEEPKKEEKPKKEPEEKKEKPREEKKAKTGEKKEKPEKKKEEKPKGKGGKPKKKPEEKPKK